MGLAASGGRNASCVTLQPGGTVGWQCFPGCHDLFGGDTVLITLRSAQSGTGDPVEGGTNASTGNAASLPLKVLISRAFFNETNAVGEAICQNTPLVSSANATPAGVQPFGFANITFPWDAFQCGPRNVTQSNANRVALQNTGGGDASFCVLDLRVA
jgi:hypothetical protein